MLTKALVQTSYLRGLHRPLREQARSHEDLCVTLSAEHVAGTYRSSRSASQLHAASRWTEIFLGVSLLTKTLVQTPYFPGLHRPLREQARSHEDLCVTLSAEHVGGTYRSSLRVGMHFVTLRVTAKCCITLDRNLSGSELAHEGVGPNTISPGPAPASSRASSLPRRLVCKAERGACCGHLSFLTLRVTATCCITLDRNLCGSELAHEGVGPNTISPGAAPASSRASSLPRRLVCNAERGACCRHLSFLTLRVTASCCITLDRNHCGSELAHEGVGPNTISPGAAPASSRASSLPRRLCITLSAAHRHDGVLRDTSRSACFSVAMHFGDALRHMALIAIRHARE